MRSIRQEGRQGRRMAVDPESEVDRCAGELGGVTAGHQAKWVAALITSGMSARVRQRSLFSAASRSSSVAEVLVRDRLVRHGQRCSAAAAGGVETAGTASSIPLRHDEIAADVPAGVVQHQDHGACLAGTDRRRGTRPARR